MMRVEFVGNTPPTKTVLATKHGDIFKIDGQYYIRGFDAVILLRPALEVTVIGCLNLRGD
jgi:hypothetical protein